MRKLLVIAAALLALASCTEKKVEKEMSIQLYSFRQLIGRPELYQQNHEAVFKAIKEYGYTSVEAASYSNGLFYGVSPEQYKADVEAAGLKSFSSHTNRNLTKEELETGDLTAAIEWWKEAIPAHKAAGMSVVVIPSMRRPTSLAELKVFCNYLNEVGKLFTAEGMLFGYHSHSFEFEKLEDQVVYDFMLENTDPQYVFFQMDVYWAVIGKVSPVFYFNKYPGRFKVLHIKDWKEIGQSGMVGFDAIFKNFDVAGTKAYVVEMEASSYNDMYRTARESAEYLYANDFVKPSYE